MGVGGHSADQCTVLGFMRAPPHQNICAPGPLHLEPVLYLEARPAAKACSAPEAYPVHRAGPADSGQLRMSTDKDTVTNIDTVSFTPLAPLLNPAGFSSLHPDGSILLYPDGSSLLHPALYSFFYTPLGTVCCTLLGSVCYTPLGPVW